MAQGFYSGSVAQKMAAYFGAIGADLTLEDFQDHTGEWLSREVSSTTAIRCLNCRYRWIAALMMLNILKNVDLRDFDRGSPEIFHYMVEAKRLAFEAMAGTFADPAYADIPIDELLSEKFARRQFALLRVKALFHQRS